MAIAEELAALRERTLAEIAAADTSAALEAVRVAVLGKSGTLTGYLRSMGQVPAEERASVGKAVNAARVDVEEALGARKAALDAAELEAAMGAAAVDVTLPGRAQQVGTRHLINGIIDEVSDIFLGLGYKVVEGEEIETDYYNFTALNAPADHPSRSMQDTFYVHDLSGDTSRVRGESDVLLRTQTSGVQVHVMEDWDLPIYMIAPGKVYRRDVADPSHLPQFHQIEGLVVDRGITFGDLKGTLDYVCKQIFGPERKTRFRAHYFPFTEPSAEADVSCGICHGEGCRMCKGTGWIEILGCGMVDPNVLSMSGIDPEEYSGFAFGMGVERIACLKYDVPDLRMLLEGDMRLRILVRQTVLARRKCPLRSCGTAEHHSKSLCAFPWVERIAPAILKWAVLGGNMKVSLKWLSEYTAVPEDLKAFCDRLDLTGTGVEGVEKTGEAFEGVVVGHVVTCEPHPDSDHMHVVTVDVGAEEPVQIVCGAPNIAADIKVPVALVGAVLPGDFKIKKSKLRGVVSCGMCCSRRELGLGQDHSGIWVLPEDAPVGQSMADFMGAGDTVLDLEITPNRPDCLSMVGMAREVGAMYQQPVTWPLAADVEKLPAVTAGEDVAGAVTVEVPDAARCPRYTARIIDNVKVGPSPEWLAERVTAAGGRSINNVVDVTNYILYLYGQPLHAFDFAKVASADGCAHIIVRAAADGEHLVTLDGEDRALTEDMTVIATPERAVALAGVMGGENSEVTEETTCVLLESAASSAVAPPARAAIWGSSPRPPCATSAAWTTICAKWSPMLRRPFWPRCPGARCAPAWWTCTSCPPPVRSSSSASRALRP